MKPGVLVGRRFLLEGAVLIAAWIVGSSLAQIIAAHSECVGAYRSICAWWAVLFACAKLDPSQRGMSLTLVFWISGSSVDLLAHSGWIYPKSVDLVSVEAARLVVSNAVFAIIAPFYLNRAVNLLLTTFRNRPA
jgi:hypothetical protein